MQVAALVVGLVFCLGAVLDAFQTIILPRRPAGRLRITRLFLSGDVDAVDGVGAATRKREGCGSRFTASIGPLSLLLLLVVWAVLLVAGFALFFFAMGSPFADCDGDAGAGGSAHLPHRSLCERDDAVYAGAGRCGAARVWRRGR